MNSFYLTLLPIVLAALPAIANDCSTDPEKAVTTPAPVEIKSLLEAFGNAQDAEETPLFDSLPEGFISEIQEIYSLKTPKSKIEQFYATLYSISAHTRRSSLSATDAQKILLKAKVFSKPTVPRQIASVEWKNSKFDIQFKTKELRIPLNAGKGFATFKEGLCQIAQELIFWGGFQFSISKNSDGNIEVDDLNGVDLFGTFGSRGIVDVDLNYVSLLRVEFIKGTPLGIVRAKISDREFETNEHSFLLKLVNQFVRDTSRQAIDW